MAMATIYNNALDFHHIYDPTMHKRTGIRLLYREMLRGCVDTSHGSERAHAMGILLSAKRRRDELENLPKERGCSNKSNAKPSSDKKSPPSILSSPKLVSATNVYKSKHPRPQIPKRLPPRNQCVSKGKKSLTQPSNKTATTTIPTRTVSNRWEKEERKRLNDLYWEIGRPKPTDDQSSINYLLKLYARRHRVIYQERSEEEVVERVRHMILYNRFKEPEEEECWKMSAWIIIV